MLVVMFLHFLDIPELFMISIEHWKNYVNVFTFIIFHFI